MGVFQLQPLAAIAEVIHKTSLTFHKGAQRQGWSKKPGTRINLLFMRIQP